MWGMRSLALVVFLGLCACDGPVDLDDAGPDGAVRDASSDAGVDGGNLDAGTDAALPPPTGPGFEMFRDDVQPALVSACGSCHLGRRFAFASLHRAGADFTDDETIENYRTFLALVSLDAPEQSRLLAKTVSDSDPRAMPHGGGRLLTVGDATYSLLRTWIDTEQADRCPGCGLSATRAFVAYVDQPSLHWAARRDPIRADLLLRRGARLMLQPVDPATLAPNGEPIDFLPESFCPSDGDCDIGRVAANYAGTQLAFECRLPVDAGAASWLDLSWNLCLADIGEDGRAVSPRFLRPPGERHRGWTRSRTDPFGIVDADGWPSRGHYDLHFQLRQRNDLFPVYTPDDQGLVFSSRSPDPRTGAAGTRTYHGFEHTNNIVSTDLTGGDARSLYLNEGGSADSVTFTRDGNVVMHVWNLERMDRHLYARATADGMMEMPILFGRTQGPNMWGPITQLANGGFIGMTGHRRGAISLFVPFFADHTIGLGLDPAFPGFAILDPAIVAEMDDNFAYCTSPPDGRNCWTSRFYADPSYSPDGRALVSHHPRRTQYSNDDDDDQFYLRYGRDPELVQPYVPELEIALLDMHGAVSSPLITPQAGRSLRYPVYVARRWAPLEQPRRTDETQSSAELHIADFRLWLAFREEQSQMRQTYVNGTLDRIRSVRVLYKELAGNACTSDAHPYRRAVYYGHDHPTHIGINNATGYVQLFVPMSEGGDGHGDVPLQPDGSVRLRVPAGALLLLQGVDADGHMVRQHSRVFSMPPGHRVDTSVRREQYHAQCASCHGSISDAPFPTFDTTPSLAAEMDFDTMASAVVDLTRDAVEARPVTYRARLRPLVEARCVSCHSGASPAAELTLATSYSSTANAPAGRWASLVQADYASYLAGLSPGAVVRGYDWSPSLDHVLQDEPYLSTFVDSASPAAPMAALAPWEPGYQSLMLAESLSDGRFRYLTDTPYPTNFGRGGDYSRTSYLLEVLSGRDLDPRTTYAGLDHTGMLDDEELRSLMALIDNGFAYTARCDDRIVPSGPNAGQPWGDPVETPLDL